MNYLYYPGCSLEGTAKEYDLSTRAFLEAAGAVLEDLPDWTCCGASAAEAISGTLSLALPARNLSLAERHAPGTDILAPCSACYLNLKKASMDTQPPAVRDAVNAVLKEEDLLLHHTARPRHLLDILVNDIGPDAIHAMVRHPLDGLIVAPYYGCQCLRPYPVFDDPERPRSMEALITAVGARVHPWDMGGRCCGASHMSTKIDVALDLVAAILHAAQGADVIVTVCPMCQINLDGWQANASRMAGEDLSISVLYLPQLLGLALGLDYDELGLDLNLAIERSFRERMKP